jgi:hypothetical protein
VKGSWGNNKIYSEWKQQNHYPAIS